MSLYKNVELLSLGLSITTIVLSAAVVLLWAKATYQIVKSKRPLDAMDWFIIGVFLGFSKDVLDNVYWTIPWSLHFLDDPKSTFYFMNGVFSNVPVRQILGSFSAYCHIRAHYQFKNDNERRHDVILKFAISAGFAYSILMVITGFQ